MSEPFDARTRSRLQSLYAYTIALEQGDLDTVAWALQEAEQDAVLERMILELHAASLEAPRPEQNLAGIARNSQAGEKERARYDRDPDFALPSQQAERPPARGQHKRHARLTRGLQSLAAVLVIGVLVGGFALLLAHHPGSTGNTGQDRFTVVYKDFVVAVASSDGTVYALQSKTGKVLWHDAIHQAIDMLVQQGGALYVATSTSKTLSHYLYKFRLEDGKLLWGKSYPHIGGEPSALTVESDVIAISGGEGSFDVVSAQDGSVLWHYVPNPPRSTQSISAYPIVGEYNHVLYIQIDGSGIEAVQFATGKRLWFSTTATWPGWVMFTSKIIYAWGGPEYTLTMLATASGKQIGSLRLSKREPPSTGNSEVEIPYASSTDGDWLYLITSKLRRATPTCAIHSANGSQVCRATQICAIHSADGSQVWCHQAATVGRIYLGGPVLMNNTFYFMYYINNNWQIAAIDTRNGMQRWYRTNPAEILPPGQAPLAGYGGILFITTREGIFALSGKDGHILWHSLPGSVLGGALPSVPGGQAQQQADYTGVIVR